MNLESKCIWKKVVEDKDGTTFKDNYKVKCRTCDGYTAECKDFEKEYNLTKMEKYMIQFAKYLGKGVYYVNKIIGRKNDNR